MLPLPSSFQIARSLSKEHYALVFGINTFAASVLQTLLTAVVLNTKSLQLTVATQVSYISTIQACPMFGSTLINTPAALLFQRLLWLHSGSLLHHVAAMYHDCDFFPLAVLYICNILWSHCTDIPDQRSVQCACNQTLPARRWRPRRPNSWETDRLTRIITGLALLHSFTHITMQKHHT